MIRLVTCLVAMVYVLGTWTACEETPLEPLEDKLETYYPLELDRPTYYRVDSVILVRTVNGVRYDSSSTEARETLVESFLGADGETYYRGERWERPNPSVPYRFKQTFTLSREGSSVVRSEDNLTFTKLVAPVREGVTWDGNRAFDVSREIFVGGELLEVYQWWDYRYTNSDTTVVLRTGVELDSVVTVQQAAVSDVLTDYRQAYEWYAPGIGLVERFLDARATQCVDCCDRDYAGCSALPWDEKSEKGYIIHQTFLSRD